MGLGEQRRHLGHPGWGSWVHLSKSQMLEDLFYDLSVLDERNNPHRPAALGARQGVYFKDLLYQPRPVPAIPFG